MSPTKLKNNFTDVVWGVFIEKLLENWNAFVMISDPKGNIVFANSKFLYLFDLTPKEAFGKKWEGIIVPEDKRKAVKKIFADLKKKKRLGKFDCPVNSSRKRVRQMCWISLPLLNHRSYYMFLGEKIGRGARDDVKVHGPSSPKLKTAYQEVIDAIFEASRMSDPETAKHAKHVMSFAVKIAEKMGISKTKIERLKIASLIHDLGKLAVDEKILFKKGKLNTKEFDEIKKHPHWGAEVISLVYFMHDIIPIMANHHENYDGSGYPRGVRGKRIPVESRILSVADIYEALTADRPYRKGFSKKKAIAIIEEEKGKKLDPEITDIFLDMVRKGKISRRRT